MGSFLPVGVERYCFVVCILVEAIETGRYYLTICLPVGAEMIIVGILHSEDQKKLHPLIINNSNSMMKGQCPYMTIVNLFVSS